MKKIYFLLCLFAFAFVSKGQQLFVDDFTYSGALNANGWTTHSGAGSNIISTTTGLIYTGYAGSGIGNAALVGNAGGEDVNATFTTQNTNGQSIYYAFMVNVTDASNSKSGDYFFITGSPGGPTWTSFAGRVFAKIVSGNVNFGLSNTSTATYGTTNFAKNTTYLLILKYTINTSGSDPVSLWVIPSGVPTTEALAGTPEITNTTTAGTDVINAVGLRQGSSSTQPQTVVDGIRVGTTWASVTSSAPAPAITTSGSSLSFGSSCQYTTSASQSFTITGSNLTTANVDVAALAGYSFSTDNATYSPSLSIPQTGGSFSQTIYVQFNPTAVQSYNGNISISGGGVSTPITVAVTGTGVNTPATVTTNGATAISQTDATLNGSFVSGCSGLTEYGFEYGTTSGTYTTVATASSVAGSNFSGTITGLTPGTQYFYRAYVKDAAGTVYGGEQSFITLTPNPSLSATALTAFGNVCANATAGPNSFTISGSNLTAANVDVAPLAGFSYSTTANGTYTNSLSLTQTGGTFSQTIYVQFNPTAVQSYGGDIVISGGGATSSFNVAASGAGVSTPPSVTTGTSSNITTTTATLAGTVTNQGCTNVTTYGIEYSTTNGFANGAGTQVASTNLNSTNFTSALSGLAPSTAYYYRAYATNAGGTTYGAQQSFTTATPPPPSITTTALAAFGNVCINTTGGPNSFTINGSNLTAANITVGALAGYTYATTANGTYAPSLSLTQTGGTYAQTIYVKFTPTATQAYNGNIPVSGGGFTSASNVAAIGTGVNTQATVTTDGVRNITTTSALLIGTVTANGCSVMTKYGFEYSSINNFPIGSGTTVYSNSTATSGFTYNLNGLVQGATYYYRAFATNSGGTAYGPLMNFTINAIQNSFTIYPVPAVHGSQLVFSIPNVKAGYYALAFYNTAGQKVYQKEYNVQGSYINENFKVPASLQPGVYYVQLVNYNSVIASQRITIF